MKINLNKTKLNQNKKAVVFRYLIIGIVSIVAMILVIAVFRQLILKQGEGIGDMVKGTDDLDGDGVLNFRDLCCNTPAGDEVDLTGCSKSGEEKCSCKDANEGKCPTT